MAKATAVKRGRKAVEKKNTVLKKLVVQYIKTSDLKPNDYNPNRQSDHDFQLLIKSMSEDGFTQPIVCLKDLTIVDGEHRWRASRELGYKEIPVVIVDMTPEQMRIATLRHNRARGSEDVELTAAVLRDLQELGAIEWAQDSLMLDDVEMNRLLEDISAPEALGGEEFTQAWEPEKGDSVALDQDLVESKDRAVAISQKASDAIRQREAKLAEAKTEEERVQIKRESNIYRIVLVFEGGEAEMVKGVLGQQPAAKVVELCRAQAN